MRRKQEDSILRETSVKHPAHSLFFFLMTIRKTIMPGEITSTAKISQLKTIRVILASPKIESTDQNANLSSLNRLDVVTYRTI